LGAAARVGDPVILPMARERVEIPYGDARWNGLLHEPRVLESLELDRGVTTNGIGAAIGRS
jgi:hypothetical protein